MTTVQEIKQAILNLPKTDYAEILEWLHQLGEEEWDRQIEAEALAGKLDFLKERALKAKRDGTLGYLSVSPFQQWKLFPEIIASRWEKQLDDFEEFIHFTSSTGRNYVNAALTSMGPAPQERDTSPTERSRMLLAVLADLHMKSCSSAGAILAALRSGYPTAGWILCRTMLETLILGRFLVKHSEEDAAERYFCGMSLSFSGENYSEEAEEFRDMYNSLFPDAAKYGWASGIGNKRQWNIREMAQDVGSEHLYTAIYKSECRFAHPDPSGFFCDVDEEPAPLLLIAHLDPFSSKLYGQTDGVSIIWVANEVTQYLAATTQLLFGVWELEASEILEASFWEWAEETLDLLEQAAQVSPLIGKVIESVN